MKKTTAVIFAVIILLSINSAMAAFDSKYIRDYVQENDGIVYETMEGSWLFTLPRENCFYPSTVNGTEAHVLFLFGIVGADIYALPCLIFGGESDYEFVLEKVEINIGDDLFRITDLDPKFINVEKRDNGRYGFHGLIMLEPSGIQLFNSLEASNYVYDARFYSKSGQKIDFSQLPDEKMTASYHRYYQALVGSDYLDKSGNPSKATIKAIRDEVKDQVSKVEKTKRELSAAPTPRPDYLSLLGQDIIAKYKLIQVGNSGDDVSLLKSRLYKLGYAKSKSGNNKYTKDTAKTIKEFQAINSLEQTGDATPDTQALLYSEYALPKPTPTPKPTKTPKPSPTPYIEPEEPIEMTGDYSGKLSYGFPWFEFTVKNISNSKTVDGFTVVYFGADVYGEKMPFHGFADVYEYETVNKTIKPGKKASTGKITAYGIEKAKRIYFAISKIHCTDGTTIEIDERDWYFKSVEY